MNIETSSVGVILSATGPEKYLRLAVWAAGHIKMHNPNLPVDLYTDQPHNIEIFDQIHHLENPWFRSRIDAMRASRFEKTLMLDSDVLILADISDIFQVLERFDIALAHDQERNGTLSHTFWRKELPAAFAQFNGGVIAYRKSRQMDIFLSNWADAVRIHKIGRDQPTLRELLWDSDLRIATLPPEYNLMTVSMVRSWTRRHPAPRIIHSPHFHNEIERYMRVNDPLTERAGLWLSWKIKERLLADWDLSKRSGRAALEPQQPQAALRKLTWIAQRLPRRIGEGVVRIVRRKLRN